MKTNSFAFLIITCLMLSACSKKDFPDQRNWENLDYLLRGSVQSDIETNLEITYKLWENDITFSIEGEYQKGDSLRLDTVMLEFGKVIPNLKLKWCEPGKKPKLSVFLTDLSEFNRSYYINYINLYRKKSNQPTKIYNYKLNITTIGQARLVIDKSKSATVSGMYFAIAKCLVESKDFTGLNTNKISILGGEKSNLTSFDKFFFKTIYSEDFIGQYAKYMRAEFNFFEELTLLTDQGTLSSLRIKIQIFLIFVFLYFGYILFWKKYLERKNNKGFDFFWESGLIVLIAIFLSGLITIPFEKKIYFQDLNYFVVILIGIVVLILGFASYLFSISILYYFEHILSSEVKKFNNRQLVRAGSMIVVFFVPSVLIFLLKRNSNFEITPSIQMFDLISGVFMLIALRLIYFHDRHQKEIIRQQQQIKFDKLEHLQTQARLEAIHARTNPHFLYNSLNTIASLTRQDAAKAEDFALKLSKLMRWRTNTEQPAEICLSNEMEIVKLYLDIEKERFGNRFQFNISIPETPERITLPSDIILHLVENAVKHGVSEKEGGSWLEITVTEKEGYLKIVVADNGPDFPDDLIRGTGLKNILQKLDILYPDRYEFVIFKTPKKCVEITIKKE